MKKIFGILFVIFLAIISFCIYANASDTSIYSILKNDVDSFGSIEYSEEKNGKFTVEDIIEICSRLYNKNNKKVSSVEAEAFENFVVSHFDIDSNELRNSTKYNSNNNTYNIETHASENVVTFLGAKKKKNDYHIYFSVVKPNEKAEKIIKLTASVKIDTVKYYGFELQTDLPDNLICPDGWIIYPSGTKSYYKNATKCVGLTKIKNKYYLFSDKGTLCTGNQKTKIGNNYYYFEKSGNVAVNCVKTTDGKSYYYDKNGKLYLGTGKVKISKGVYYFFNKNHSIAVNCVKKTDDKSYYYDKNGKLYLGTGKVKISKGVYYFFNKNHSIAVNCVKKTDSKSYYYDKNGKLYLTTGKVKISKGVYYFFNKDHSLAINSLKTVDKKTYYFGTDGIMVKNKIAGNYYFGKDGVKSTDKQINKAVAFVNKYSKSTCNNSERLKTCFTALCNNNSYKRSYETPSANNISKLANDLFVNHYGNCFNFASAFCYIAKVLGYNDIRFNSGKCSSIYGGYPVHGWAEIKLNGKWYVCDPVTQKFTVGYNYYMINMKDSHIELLPGTYYYIGMSNGKVSWK